MDIAQTSAILKGAFGFVTNGSLINAKLPKNTIALIGDSLTAYNSSQGENKPSPPVVGTFASMNAAGGGGNGGTGAGGPFTWANALMGNPFNVIYYGGVSGERTDSILTRAPAILATGAAWLCEQGGTNDIAQLAGTYGGNVINCANAVVNNRTAIWQQAAVLGVNVIALAITPVLPGQGWSAAQCSLLFLINRRLKIFAQTAYGNVVWVDTCTPFVDVTTANGTGLTACYSDFIHPSPYGAFLQGLAIQAAVSKFVKPNANLVQSQSDCIQSDANSKNLLAGSFGLFQGSGGTGGVGITGVIAAGTTVARGGTPTIVCSTPASPDGVGNAQRLVITAASSADSAQVQIAGYLAPNLTQFPVGSQAYMEVVVTISSATSVLLPSLDCRIVTNLGNLFPASMDTAASGIAYGTGAASYTVTLRSGIITFTNDATSLSYFRAFVNLGFTGAGGATMDVYRATVCKI